jgi:multiple sugar transport system substrate-binding protein
MKTMLMATSALGFLCLAFGAAHAADCGIAKGSVRILSNDFEALRIVAAAAKECETADVKITANQTAEHKNLQGPALTINPAEYTIAVVANNSIVPLLNEGLIRPLDDLVAKYGKDLQPNQMIKIDGKVMAIAFMGNAQHLFYRKDVLEKAGLQPPKSYEDVLANARVLKEKGIMEYPLGASDKAGWDLAAEFVNMYLGYDGQFFEPGSAKVTISNDKGIETLKMMKALTEYMAPEYMSYDANELNKVYQGGRIGMMNQWGSLAGSVLDSKTNTAEVANNSAFGAAPTVAGGSIPAAALWWDGFTIAKNISDEDAEASFQAMMHAIRPEIATTHSEAATWLIKGFKPGPAAVGILATANAGAKPYPMLPYMGLLHTALSTELADFMQGKEDAEKALADVEAAYTAAAREGGFLQ